MNQGGRGEYGKNYEDLSVECVDFQTAQALVDDISKKKEAYHVPENNFKVEEV